MNIVIDMNLSPEWRDVLSSRGFNAVHWLDIGIPSAPDREILAWARDHHHVVFTQDLDFGALLAASGSSAPSVLQLRSQAVLPEDMAEVVVAAFRQFADVLEQGALITVEPTHSRARILPLSSRQGARPNEPLD